MTSPSSSLVILFRLIEANDWRKLTNVFLSDAEGKQRFQHLSALVARSSTFNGMTILHAVARFDPPAELIHRIVELCPCDANSLDCLNRTPLHVAAGCKANTATTKLLAGFHPEACMIRDRDGRTPLHMACDRSCELFEDPRKVEKERPPPSYRTVAVLLAAGLDAAVLEDDDGMSAIEYALCSDADLKTVRLLQKAAQKVHKRTEAKKKERDSGGVSPVATKAQTTGGKVSRGGPSPPARAFSPRGLLGAPSA